MNPILELLPGRHVGHVEAAALGVELPAVVDAADAVTFGAAEEQRRAAVRTAVIHDSDPTPFVAEGDQLLAQQQQTHRRRAGLELRRQARRNPVLAHQIAHKGARADPGQVRIVACGSHAQYHPICHKVRTTNVCSFGEV